MHTVLVVEDSQDVRDVLVEMLESVGFQVFWASSGAEAMQSIEMIPELDVVVADFTLSDGRGFVPQCKVVYPSLPVVVLSGDPDAARTELPQADEVLGKPLPLKDLLRVVHNLALQRSQTRARKSS